MQGHLPSDWTGASIVQGESMVAYQKEAVSQTLNEAGIPGIKYLDQGSRQHAADIANAEKVYRVVGIRMQKRLANLFYGSRLIWEMRTGEDPVAQIDRIDGDRLNNRWNNLRPATNGTNIWNSKLRKDNASGFKGVVS